jgi:hypothetical protein
LPDLRYTLLDLSQTDNGFLSRHRVLRFGFKVLKYGARDGDAREILKMLIREALAEGLDDEIVVLVRFVVMEPSGLEKGVLREMLTEVMPEKKAVRVLSIAEQWVVEGQAMVVLRQMTRRFGPLPDALRQKVLDGSPEEVDAWADALIDGKTLDEIFALSPSANS